MLNSCNVTFLIVHEIVDAHYLWSSNLAIILLLRLFAYGVLDLLRTLAFVHTVRRSAWVAQHNVPVA